MSIMTGQTAPNAQPPKKLLAVVYRQPESLVIDPKNPRRHSDKQIKQLMRSIKAFDFIVPALIDSMSNVITGHARVLAARQLGLKAIPTILINHLSSDEIKAFKIADNRLSDMSDWDDRILAETLKELQTADLKFNIEDIGFTLDEIDARIEELSISPDGTPAPDDQLPDMVEGPTVSMPGDLWLLGDNRVLHGDTTKPSDIENLMNGKRAAMAFTDPPYNVDYGSSAKDKMRDVHRPILNDNLGEGFGAFLSAACANILAVTDGGIYICMSSSELHTLQSAFAKAGGHWSTFIIWAKQAFTLGRADYQRQYEPILYGWREGTERHWCGARDQGDVWFINRPVKNDLHPTMKPVELVMQAIRNSSERGDIVLDPFLGSGSSLIASERAGRVCYGIELDPRHVDTIIRRWQRHTGHYAIHAVTGKKFDDLALEKDVHHDAA